MTAPMPAPMRSLYRAGEHSGTGVFQPGIPIEPGQALTVGDHEIGPTQVTNRSTLSTGHPFEKRRLVLPLESRIDPGTSHTRVQAVEGDGEIRSTFHNFANQAVGETGGSVHRHRDGHPLRPGEIRVGQVVDCDVHRPHLVANITQGRRGRGEVNGLAAELVGGDEEDPHGDQLTAGQSIASASMFEYLDLESGPIHWKDYGGSGMPVVMVHGLGGSIANWDVIGPRLASQARVVAIDLPGFGMSPPAGDWSVQTHANAVIEVIGHVGSPAILVGNSLGGLVAELVASSRPELVSALVLISPATPPRLPDPYLHWPTAFRLLVRSTPLVGPALFRWELARTAPRQLISDSLTRITHNRGRVPLDLVESFVALAERRSHFPWAGDAVPKTAQSIRATFLKRGDFTSMIRDITAPTLVIQGIEDRIVSRTAVEWLCWIRPDWTLVQLDDTGHTPQLDAPVRTLSAIQEWLTSLQDDAPATALALAHVL